MKRLQELQSEIERVRPEVDKLIEDYMQYTKDEYHLRDCG